MSNYNDNWKAFVDETKEMSDEQLQEYISDIRSAVSGLFNQSGQGTQYSGLKGYRPQTDPKGPKEEPKEEPKEDSVDVSKLTNAGSLNDYKKEYNKLVVDSEEDIMVIDESAIELVLRLLRGGEDDTTIVNGLQGPFLGPFSAFGDPKTLKRFVELVRKERL